jgi:hypothetical protein
MRSLFWFEQGELWEIGGKLIKRKWGYEARWEAVVLCVLALFVLMAFGESVWFGVSSIWLVKEAIRSLNKKHFFDPLP